MCSAGTLISTEIQYNLSEHPASITDRLCACQPASIFVTKCEYIVTTQSQTCRLFTQLVLFTQPSYLFLTQQSVMVKSSLKRSQNDYICTDKWWCLSSEMLSLSWGTQQNQLLSREGIRLTLHQCTSFPGTLNQPHCIIVCIPACLECQHRGGRGGGDWTMRKQPPTPARADSYEEYWKHNNTFTGIFHLPLCVWL